MFPFVDFMALPVPVSRTMANNTNRQYAFYVNTNCQLVIWHQNRIGAPTNEWLTLATAPLISTSAWAHFTVEQDYVNHRFQVRVNQSEPFTDAAGWSENGLSQPGSWFYMVQTNDSMSRIQMLGSGYFDDITVQTTLDNVFLGAGSVYIIR